MHTIDRLRRGTLAAALLAPLAPLTPPAARAHGPAHGSAGGAPRKEQTDWGIAGERRDARRTIEVGMSDTMRFTPARIDVKLGETVRFVVHNRGKVMHEFVIGTEAENRKHAELMKKHPGMEHDEPYMAHVAPGRRGEIVWLFNRAGAFEFACLVAGHYDAGMKGLITVSA